METPGLAVDKNRALISLRTTDNRSKPSPFSSKNMSLRLSPRVRLDFDFEIRRTQIRPTSTPPFADYDGHIPSRGTGVGRVERAGWVDDGLCTSRAMHSGSTEDTATSSDSLPRDTSFDGVILSPEGSCDRQNTTPTLGLSPRGSVHHFISRTEVGNLKCRQLCLFSCKQ